MEVSHSTFLFKLSQGLQNSSVTLDQHQYENVCSLLKEASLPFYTRGLAARVLALVYFRQQQLVHDFQNNASIINALIRILNKCAVGTIGKLLHKQDIHRIRLNCGAALTLLCKPIETRRIGKWCNPTHDLLYMPPEPFQNCDRGVEKAKSVPIVTTGAKLANTISKSALVSYSLPADEQNDSTHRSRSGIATSFSFKSPV